MDAKVRIEVGTFIEIFNEHDLNDNCEAIL